MSRVEDEPTNLLQLYLVPELRDMGIEMFEREFVLGRQSGWVKEKVKDPQAVEDSSYMAFQRGASVGFFYSREFRECWEGTYKERPAWEEMRRRGVVSALGQAELPLSSKSPSRAPLTGQVPVRTSSLPTKR